MAPLAERELSPPGGAERGLDTRDEPRGDEPAGQHVLGRDAKQKGARRAGPIAFTHFP